MPGDFPNAPLGEVAAALKDGTHGTHVRVSTGVPFLSAKNITETGEVSWDETDFRISESEYDAIHRNFRLEQNDLLITIVGSLGRRALYNGSKVTFQRSVAYVRPDESKVTPGFLFHATGDARYQRQLRQRSNATAQAGLYLGELALTTVPLPPLPEQRRIAEILDTVDEAIRRTEQVIAKLEQMKQGLLHDLLTRGIDDNGELRDPERHPEQFKESPLGRIPMEWDVRDLGQLLTTVYRYPTYYGIQYAEYGVPEVRGELVQRDGRLNPDPSNYRYITPATAARFPKVHLAPGDFVLTVRGTLGKVAEVPDWLSGAVITANLLRLAFQRDAVSVPWMRHYLLSPTFQDFLDLACSATTIKTIQIPALASIRLCLPSLAEQTKIAAVVEGVDARLDQENVELGKMRSVKQGLTDDLLTGRVRVRVDAEAA